MDAGEFMEFAFISVFVLQYAYYLGAKILSDPICLVGGVDVRMRKGEGGLILNAVLEAPLLRPIMVLDRRLSSLPEPAVESVLAHEIAHLMLRSSLKQFFRNTTFVGVAMAVAVNSGNLVLAVAVLCASLPLNTWLRRREEFKADELASKLIGAERLLEGYCTFLALEGGKEPSLLSRALSKVFGEPTIRERVEKIAEATGLNAC